MSLAPKRAFFDELSDKWDALQDMDQLPVRLREGLGQLGIRPSESILDLGSGTGNLTLALMEWLGSGGEVVAVDISLAMLKKAGEKCRDPRHLRICASAEELPLANGTFQRVICFSAWPHFTRPRKAISELFRLLRPQGTLHIWHLIPRQKVNVIHSQAGEAVSGDILPPAIEVAKLLTQAGFEILVAREDSRGYLVSAIRP